MKLIGFAQLRNELEKGNLDNWFGCMNAICDKIYIYDQNSTDGSQEYYEQFDHVTVIENTENGVANLGCKTELLELVKKENDEGDWVFWVDGDTLVEKRFVENPQGLKDFLSTTQHDAFAVGHYNLWRSDLYYRLDKGYHSLHGRCVALWRLSDKISIVPENRLHATQYPQGLRNIARLDLDLIHRGFSTDYQLITRYELYTSMNEAHKPIDDEEGGFQVEKLDPDKIPDFAPKEDIHPATLRPLLEIYNETKA